MHDIRNINDAELLQWIRLCRCRGIGPKTFFDLLQVYGSAKAALDILPNMMTRAKKANRNICSLSAAKKELDAIRKLGGRIIAFLEPDYPKLLRDIPDPPPIITILGDVSVLKNTPVAVVGSRKASINSCKFAQLLSRDLCKAGYVIVSGLAIGIDSVAHNTTMNENGYAIAVLGSGVDVVYPQRNYELYNKIKERGVIMSELPLGTTPQPRNFSSRNRIISGLSLGVAVVEAGLASGSLITARRAMEQKRAVFAVPGFPLDLRFSGGNKLIKQNAFLIESAQDVISVIDNCQNQKIDLFDSSHYKLSSQNRCAYESQENEIDKVKYQIISALDNSPISINDIARHTNSKLNNVLVALAELEIEGKLERHSGNKVCLLY